MIKELDLSLSPAEAATDAGLRQAVSDATGIDLSSIIHVHIARRSIDARARYIRIRLKVQVYIDEPAPVFHYPKENYHDARHAKPVIIVGAGPAGLFAALRLLELGLKPIILERGKDVQSRRRDLAAIHKKHLVDPDSNYCFGEGGAGTYSDGKLYTRSTKRGDVNKILRIFVSHGASDNILAEAHPHIGTNKLPQIIISIRQAILEAGGEIHFNTRLTDLIVENNAVKGARAISKGEEKEFTAANIILATGHSARDIFHLLHKKNILIEAKPFAMGLRIEHPQALIDSMQYHCGMKEVSAIREHLPAASYSMVHQSGGRGVYSFCMCPGGIIAPCATSPGEVVTNGWSPSRRNNPFANSGMVVSIEPEDWKQFTQHGILAGLHYQASLEQMAYEAGGRTQTAPAQRMVDFINKKVSSSIPLTSYQPGVLSAPLHELLPWSIAGRLQDALKEFGKKSKGYLTNEAVLVGVESRTSSPIRIPRDKETLQHVQVKGLYPCGEGAGYAGGIISAAIDGERCAEAIAKTIA